MVYESYKKVKQLCFNKKLTDALTSNKSVLDFMNFFQFNRVCLSCGLNCKTSFSVQNQYCYFQFFLFWLPYLKIISCL
ncbi:MAG: hypothetical protein JWP37_1952 [Mucilaginibacter sp.]|nr:hypothetical protein [Mucilaginibacter sp.]